MLSRIRNKISGDKQGRSTPRSHKSAHSHFFSADTTDVADTAEVSALLAEQYEMDLDIVFESKCTFGGDKRYIVISKASIRIYKSKSHWASLKKRVNAIYKLMNYDCYAMLPEVSIQNTLLIRTTKAIFAVKLSDEDTVDQCISLINSQSTSPSNIRARSYFWRKKLTVHVFVTEAWDLPIRDQNGSSDPFVQVRVLPKGTQPPVQKKQGKNSSPEDIVYCSKIREKELNPVFSEQFTFLCTDPTDDIYIEIFDHDQWAKNDLLGVIRIDIGEYLRLGGLHGWFPIGDAKESLLPGNGYAHVKVAIADATESIEHIAMLGNAFQGLRQSLLQNITSLRPISPMSVSIPIFIGTWNVGNECPPNDVSPWIVRYHDSYAQLKSVPLRKFPSQGFNEKGLNSAKQKDSVIDDAERNAETPNMSQRLTKTDSLESIESLDDFISRTPEFGSLNDLKVRSRKPRVGVNISQHRNKCRYDSRPIEVHVPPGLYVIGCQECQYTPKSNSSSNCKDDWIRMLREHLGPDYAQVEYSSLWQIRLAIFARRDLTLHISNVCVHKEATGIAHVLGNKGGVVISFRVFQTSLCFVNCHLAAHQTKRDQRNQDIRDIITKSCSKVGNKQNDIANQFHHVWFMGDLNYRLDYGVQAAQKSPSLHEFREIESLIQAGRYSILFGFDQLSRDMTKREILAGWSEGAYDFPPSFKVERTSGFKYNSARSPAWCDRILWKSFSSSADDIVHTDMKVCESIATSDHKPIASTFSVNLFHFEESRDYNRGRAELLFTEIALSMVEPANPVQYHVRYRSDCFTQTPIVQSLSEVTLETLPVPVAPAVIPITPLVRPSEPVAGASLAADEAWLLAPAFPVIKLKHNSLPRLRQHMISVELLHVSGVVAAQGVVTFHVFTAPTIRPPLKSLTSPVPTTGLPRLSVTPADWPLDVPIPVEPTSMRTSHSDRSSTSLSMGNHLGIERRVSHNMVIRPSLGNESSRNSGSESVNSSPTSQRLSAVRKHVSSISESEQRRQPSSQLEQFTNLQCNVPFVCELTFGTTFVGTLSGMMRLSWAN